MNGNALEQCPRCFGRGYLPQARRPSKRNPNALGFYARTCPRCGGSGALAPKGPSTEKARTAPEEADHLDRVDVVFRVFRGGSRDVIALFPALPDDRRGLHCLSYQRVGQHGGADYDGVIWRSRPAKPEEYEALRKELEAIGYGLRIIPRATARHKRARIAAAEGGAR